MLRCYLMDPGTDVCQTGQPQISYSVDFTAEQSSAMGSPILLGREGTHFPDDALSGARIWCSRALTDIAVKIHHVD